MGYRNRSGPPGLAYRVLADVDEVFGRQLRYSLWRRGFDLSTSRKRNCAVGVSDRQAIREVLGAFALSAGRRRENVEEARQLLHRARFGADGTQTVVDTLPADVGSASQAVELYL